MDWNQIFQYVSYGEPMSRHTSFRIGGPAEIFLRPHTRQEFIEILEYAPDAFVFGNGTNLLVSDSGIKGVVVTTTGIKALLKLSETKISCECGALLSQAAAFALKLGLGGFEFAAGIPGTVGGALCMNAGAYGGEMSQVTESSDFFSRGAVSSVSEHNFGYRDSVYKRDTGKIVLSAVISLSPGNPDDIRAKMDSLALQRASKQPLDWPSAGSVFKRPAGMFAGTLIEQCGLKGFSVGGAQVSEKHAGFIINRGGATSDDVARLIGHIQETVLKNTGVMLETEILRV